MEKSIIYNEDCFVTIGKMSENEDKVDCILTSPPYNMTKRKGGYADTGRYDVYEDWKTEEDYLKWTVDLFNGFDTILNKNRVVLYNFFYSIENPSLPYKLVTNIIENTNFTVIDTIIWKKSKDCHFRQIVNDFVEIGNMCLFLLGKMKLTLMKTIEKLVL